MSVIFLLIIISIIIASGFLASFYFAIKRNQYDDIDTPARRMLIEDKPIEIKQMKDNKVINLKVKDVARNY